MALTLSVYTLRETVRNYIGKNNTTTASFDLSTGLEERVKDVKAGYHKALPVPLNQYPIVWVELVSKVEDFALLGNSGRRSGGIEFDVYGIVQQGMGAYDGREVSDAQMIKLSNNVETLFRTTAGVTLSNTAYVQDVTVAFTEYDIQESAPDTWNSVARHRLRIRTQHT